MGNVDLPVEIKKKSSSRHGGHRPGAGRKPWTLKGIAKKLPRESAELILAEIKANEKWVILANSKKEAIVLETLKYLTDRAYGKAKQAMEVTGAHGGPIQHEYIDVSKLSDEQLRQIETLVESAYAGTNQG